MSGPGLPTNVASGGTTTGHKTHTDTVHGLLNKFDTGFGTATTGNPLVWDGTVYVPANSSGPDVAIQSRLEVEGLIVYGDSRARIPYNSQVDMDGSLLTAANPGDKVGMQNAITFLGGFSAESGYGLVNPDWLFGTNDFIQTGTASGDIAGISNFRGRLTEIHIASPNANLDTAWTLQVDTEIDSTATAATIDSLAGLYVKSINNGGGGGVTVTDAYQIFFGTPNVGTNRWGLYQEGEASNKLHGDLLMNEDPGAPHTLNVYEGTARALNMLVGPTATGDSGFTAVARFNVKSKSDGDIVSHFAGRGGQTADIMRIATDTTVASRFDKLGRFGTRYTSAPADGDVANSEAIFYIDDSVGAPHVKVKMKDSAGTVFTKTLDN